MRIRIIKVQHLLKTAFFNPMVTSLLLKYSNLNPLKIIRLEFYCKTWTFHLLTDRQLIYEMHESYF